MKKIVTIILLIMLISTISYAQNDIFRLDKNIGDEFNIDQVIRDKTDAYDGYIFKWTALNYDLVDMNSKSDVTCIKDGSTQLIGYDDFKNKTIYVNVIVNSQVKKISLGSADLTLPLNYELKLENIFYYNFNEKLNSDKIFWTSSNEDVARIDENGTIATKSKGETFVIASSNDGLRSDYIKVKVDGKKLELDVDYEKNMNLGDKQRLNFSKDGLYESSFAYDLKSSDPLVASVDINGLVTSKNVGVAYITIRADDGSYMLLPIEVKPIIKSIDVKEESMKITKKDDIRLIDYKVEYISDEFKKYENKNIKFESSAPSVAYVTEKGEIVPRISGITSIKISTNNGITFDEIKLTVDLDRSDSVIHEFSMKSLPKKMYVGEIVKLDYETRYSLSKPEFRFTVSNGSNNQIYDVNGVYYFKPDVSGVTTINVRGSNGYTYKQSIRVISKLSKIDMNSGNYTKESDGYRMYKGQILPLEPNFIPNGRYSPSEILARKIKFEFDDEYIEKVKSDKDMIKAIKLKDSEINIETIDSKKDLDVKIYVKSAIKSAKMINGQSIEVGERFYPELDYTYVHGLTHAFDNNIKIELISELMSVDILDDELAKTYEAIDELTKTTNYNKQLLKRLNVRKSSLISMKENSSGGLATIVGNMYDTNGRKLNVANIYGNYIVGNMKGAAKIKITLSDNNQTMFGQVEFK